MSARVFLWSRSQLDRVRSCGHHSVRPDGTVAVRATTAGVGAAVKRVAGYAGIASCGSVWACPVCARKVAAARQSEISEAVIRWKQIGGSVAIGTFTVSHRLGQRLTTVWDAVSAGWAAVTSGRAWVRNRQTFGVEGWIRVVEVRHGRNGWHVHVHTLLFLHHYLSPAELVALRTALHGRWQTGIGKHGFGSSTRRGADLRMVDGSDENAADYLVKSAEYSTADLASLETARGDLKTSKTGESESPFEILARAIVQDDEDAWEVWGEWERASKGRRQMAWAKGFREFLRLTRDRTDEEIAADELGSAADDVVVLPRHTFAVIRHIASDLLDVAEQYGGQYLRDWLTGNALDWLEPADRLRV